MPINSQVQDAKVQRRLEAATLGQRLSTIRFDLGWVYFHFGPVRQVERRHPVGPIWVGATALHLMSGWRVRQPGKVLTGHRDIFRNAAGQYFDEGEWCQSPNTLCYRRLVEWAPRDPLYEDSLPGLPEGLHVYPVVDGGVSKIVTAVTVTEVGDLTIKLSDDSLLESFVNGTQTDRWRLFTPRGARIPRYEQ